MPHLVQSLPPPAATRHPIQRTQALTPNGLCTVRAPVPGERVGERGELAGDEGTEVTLPGVGDADPGGGTAEVRGGCGV